MFQTPLKNSKGKYTYLSDEKAYDSNQGGESLYKEISSSYFGNSENNSEVKSELQKGRSNFNIQKPRPVVETPVNPKHQNLQPRFLSQKDGFLLLPYNCPSGKSPKSQQNRKALTLSQAITEMQGLGLNMSHYKDYINE